MGHGHAGCPRSDLRRRRWGAARASAVFALLAAGACAEEMSPQSLVDKFRILAVRADAPEPSPGDAVRLDALLADPTGGGRTVAYLWVACLLGPARNPALCADPEQGGIFALGSEPAFTFVAPAIPEGQPDGQILVTLSVCAGGTFVIPTDGGAPTGPLECSGGDGATAYKRVIVSADDERNHNPVIEAATLSGDPLPEAPVTLPACEEGACTALDVAATLADGSAETFTEIAFGSPRERTEDVYTSWFATAGEFERTRGAGLEPDVKWTPPAGPRIVDFWFVAHDGRGGTDWLVRRVVLEE